MTPVITNVRFGKWKAILEDAALPGNYAYANVLSHWARGMAMAKKNDLEGAKEELKYVRSKKDQPGMLVVMEPFNAPADAAGVAEKILEGVIAEQENDLAGAIHSFTQAVKNEDAMIYNEPKDWLLPAREFLGAALLKNGNFAKAEAVFKEDLKENPANHWALKGLYQSLQEQKKGDCRKKIKKQLDKSMTGGDMKNMPIVF